ncbi:MAG: hypothetical protein WAM71_08530 [Candidatus Korobacteraceae bacterium]
MRHMRYLAFALAFVSALGESAVAAPLSSSARTVIPSAIQQIISVDYRELRNSPSARALKDRVMPDTLKQFEQALRATGIDPDKDAEQLTFISYRGAKNALYSIGIAQGPFKQKEFLQKARLKKIKPEKYLLTYIYPMGSGMNMAFLDPSTIVFGDTSALHGAIDVRDNGADSIEKNNTMNDLITGVDSATIWSTLDQLGTQYMMKSALGQASSLTDYDVIKKRLLASDYMMNFENGVTFDLNIKTSDTMTAASLASLVKAGVIYRKMSGNDTEKLALQNASIDSSNDMVQMHFKTDDQRFQALLKSDLFAAVAH